MRRSGIFVGNFNCFRISFDVCTTSFHGQSDLHICGIFIPHKNLLILPWREFNGETRRWIITITR